MNTFSGSILRKALASAFLAATVLVPTTYARSQSTLKVSVPFGFEDGTKHLAAGVYDITPFSQNVMSVRGNKGGALSMFRSEYNPAQKTNEKSKLIFLKYGNRYFLHEIWAEGSTSHLVAPKSKTEEQVELAQRAAAAGTAEVATLDTVR